MSKAHKKKASRLIEDRDDIASAYLFGSTSLGYDRNESDVDIAIRIRKDVSPEERFEIRTGLLSELETLLESPVDVLVMNDASLAILHQVFSSGVPLFVRDPEDEERFRLNRLKAFFDFRYYLDRDFAETKRFFEKAGHG